MKKRPKTLYKEKTKQRSNCGEFLKKSYIKKINITTCKLELKNKLEDLKYNQEDLLTEINLIKL